jgi:hypothetical protein
MSESSANDECGSCSGAAQRHHRTERPLVRQLHFLPLKNEFDGRSCDEPDP